VTVQELLLFLLSLAFGALLADALLHLLPHAFGMHEHGAEEEDDEHDHGEEGHSYDYLWKVRALPALRWGLGPLPHSRR
jgi:hypothetical protein